MLKDTIKKIIASALIAAILPVSALMPSASRADDAIDSSAIIADAIANGAHRCNVNAPRSGNVFMQLMGSFDTTSKEAILNQINSYRLEACQNGYPDPRNRSRGLTMSDYVPLRWSRGLEEMAMLRAAEATYTCTHLKTTGEDWVRSSYDVAAFAEVLAWGGNIPGGISLWYSEKSAYLSGSASVSGHYASLINPSNTYCGVAGFNSTQAGVFTNQGGLDESKIDVSRYNSQLAEIGINYVSGVAVTVPAGACMIGSTTKLAAVANISVQGYSKRLAYSGIRILPQTWWSGSPSMVTVDNVGNATGIISGMGSVYCKFNGVPYCANVRINDGSLVRNFASRLYSVALNRTPDSVGLDYWTNRLASRQISGTQAAYGFFFSQEFLNTNMSNEEYVTRLYRTFLDRDPEAQGYNYWLTRLADGASRRDVFYGFSGSAEFAGICAYAGINP
ncbi:MAG: DUF4214 domain-containing protein [Clostridiales bacterium]|nr:DUF4214 domain-containing protein [Clostridiales bacterium]